MENQKSCKLKVKGVSNFISEISKLKLGTKMKLVPTPNQWCETNIDVVTEEGNIKIGSIEKEISSKFFYFLEQGKKFNVEILRIYPVPNSPVKGVIIQITDK